MKPAVRPDAWLLSLAFAGGMVDASSYLALGKVFTANMTGNTVLLAVAAARGAGGDAARSAVALGGFCVGVLVATILMPPSDEAWPYRARLALLFELCAFVALFVIWTVVGVGGAGYALIAVASLAMGTQSAAVRPASSRGVNTTYMTGTLVSAVASLVEHVRGDSRPGDGPRLPGAAWMTYGLGALAGAFAVKPWQAEAILPPLLIIAAATLVAWRAGPESGWASMIRRGRQGAVKN